VERKRVRRRRGCGGVRVVLWRRLRQYIQVENPSTNKNISVGNRN
jgi:hypothetical protein